MTDTTCEQWRHECECREVARRLPPWKLEEFYANVERKRGKTAADRLRIGVADVLAEEAL